MTVSFDNRKFSDTRYALLSELLARFEKSGIEQCSGLTFDELKRLANQPSDALVQSVLDESLIPSGCIVYTPATAARTKTGVPTRYSLNVGTDKNSGELEQLRQEVKNHHVLHLTGSSDVSNKISFMRALLETTHNDINRIENIRTKHLNFVLVIFAAIYALMGTLPNANPLIIGVPIFLVILYFKKYDERLHLYSHGRRETLERYIAKMADTVNFPEAPCEFHYYYREGQRKARKERKTERRRIYSVFLWLSLLAPLVVKFAIAVEDPLRDWLQTWSHVKFFADLL
jgi:hypothetical protein